MFEYFTDLCQEEVEFDENNYRIRCFEHIINLAAQDILKNLKAEEKFMKYNSNKLELIMDVKTRWNSTYYMIKRALDLKKLEKFIKKSKISTIEKAAQAAKTKLEKYYPTTDGLAYIVGTKALWKSKYQLSKNVQQNYTDDNNQDDSDTQDDSNIDITDDNSTDNDDTQNKMLTNIFKKRKIDNRDELAIYLRELAINPKEIKIDTLEWWK
ncbi:20242_t:CDS:2, partial [Dentiscutata erythropus]